MIRFHRPTDRSLDALSTRMVDFEGYLSSIFSRHDGIEDTPWVERVEPPPGKAERVRNWCREQWPGVRANAERRFEEAKRRMMS